jgi:hypothetical protein
MDDFDIVIWLDGMSLKAAAGYNLPVNLDRKLALYFEPFQQVLNSFYTFNLAWFAVEIYLHDAGIVVRL